MKSIFITLAALTFTAANLTAQEGLKLAVIDMERVFSEYNVTKEGEERIKVNRTEYEADLKKKTDELKTKATEAANLKTALSSDSSLTPRGKQAIQEKWQKVANEAREMRDVLQQWSAKRQRQLSNEVQLLTSRVVKDIQAEVDKLGKAKELDLILDSGKGPGRPSSLLFDSERVKDISDEILAILNKKGSEGASEEGGEAKKPAAGDTKKAE